MRTCDVEVGRTYVVLVPHRLPRDRYSDRDRPGTPMWVASFLTGARFRLTVTGIDRDADPVTVERVRFIERASAEVVLTDDQAAALGVAAGQGFRVVGSLVDRDGQLAYLPAAEPVRVPTRWLHEPDDLGDERSHRDADHWPYM